MKRVKQFGSSLHNISKKRLAEMASGTWKPKQRKPLAKMSKKAISEWNKARNECFAIYGRKCFLCGQQYGELHCHHWQETRTQNPARKYDQSNLIPLCAKCHNHNGADTRFYELQKRIYKKKIKEISMDIETAIMKSLRDMIRQFEFQEMADIDRTAMAILLEQKDNK